MLVQLVTYKYLLLVFIIYDIYTKFSFLFLTICQIKKVILWDHFVLQKMWKLPFTSLFKDVNGVLPPWQADGRGTPGWGRWHGWRFQRCPVRRCSRHLGERCPTHHDHQGPTTAGHTWGPERGEQTAVRRSVVPSTPWTHTHTVPDQVKWKLRC